MSKIPFVNQLGDAIEQAAAARIAGRRGRVRRRIALGALGFAVAATGVAAASGIFSGTPEQLASTSVGCYDRASLEANVTVLSTGDASPIETCARVLGADGPLAACAGRAVLVFPGGKGTCERLGLEPLPAQYATARARVNAFTRDIEAIEASADCIPVRELAARVQRLLERSPGWTGWRTWLRPDLDDGPCGSVTQPGGDGSRSIEGALDAEDRRVIVIGGPSRSTMELLYGEGRGLSPEIQDASGERCYTRAGLEEMARRRLAATGRAVSFEVGESGGGLIGPRGQRMRDGCAIVYDVAAADDGYGIVVAIDE